MTLTPSSGKRKRGILNNNEGRAYPCQTRDIDAARASTDACG
jgi:hypothetical protein